MARRKRPDACNTAASWRAGLASARAEGLAVGIAQEKKRLSDAVEEAVCSITQPSGMPTTPFPHPDSYQHGYRQAKIDAQAAVFKITRPEGGS